MNMREFLTAVWPDEGPYCIATPYTIPRTETVTYAHHVTETINDAVKFARGKRETTNLFFAIHTLRHAKVWNPAKKNRKTGETGAYEVRTHANMKAARAFFFDLDVGRTTDQTTKYATREDALSDLARFLFLTGLPDPLVTSSGGGFHVYWRIADALDSLTWKVTAARLHGLARHCGMRHDPMRTTDQSSVLRIAGTYNLKTDTRRPVEVLHQGVETANAAFIKQVKVLAARHNVTDNVAQPRPALTGPHPGVVIPNNTRVAYSGKVSTMRELYDACEHVRDYVTARGNVTEPAWYSTIGLIQFVKDGPAYVHRLSRGHTGYSPASTDAKLAQYNANSDGPPTCATMDAKCGGGACARCPVAGRGANPLIITQQVSKSSPATAPPTISLAVSQAVPAASLIDPPKPYTRTKKSTIIVTKWKDNPSGSGPKVSEDTVIVPYDMFPIAAFKRTKIEPAFSTWVVGLPHEGQMIFDITAKGVIDQRQLAAELADHGVHIDPRNLPEVRNFMVAYIRALQETQRSNQQFDHLGWTQDRSKFVLPKKVLSTDGTEQPAVLSAIAKPAEQWIKQRGNIAAQVQAMKFYASDEYFPSQFAVLCSLASVLFCYTDLGGVIVSLYGDSGGSKSSTLYAGASLWGPPTQYVLDATQDGSTVNARNDQVTTLANLPVFHDEMTTMTPETAKDFALHISQFREKTRMKSDATIRPSRSEDKSLIAVVSTNMSLYQMLSINNTAGVAGSMRVFEIMMPLVDRTQKPQADAFISAINENCGWIGETFLRGIITSMPAVAQAVRNFRAKFDLKYNIAGSERFWSAVIAAVVIAGRIAVRSGLLAFDMTKLLDWIVNVQLPHMRGIITEEVDQSEPIGVIANYLEHINGDIIRVSHKSAVGNTAFAEHTPLRELKAHLEIEAGMIYVRKDAFRSWCIRDSRNPLSVLNALVAQKIVTRPNVKYVLGRGTPLAKARTTCFAIDITDSRMSGIAQAVTAPASAPSAHNVVTIGHKKKAAP